MYIPQTGDAPPKLSQNERRQQRLEGGVHIGTLDQPVIEQRDGAQGQLDARLGESLLGDLSHQLRPVVQMENNSFVAMVNYQNSRNFFTDSG